MQEKEEKKMKCKQGYHKKGDRCVKGRVSYNPFKMIGSWIGAGIPIVIWLISGIVPSTLGAYMRLILIWINPIMWLAGICSGTGCEWTYLAISFLTLPLEGFLIGWGIHSLIRRLRR